MDGESGAFAEMQVMRAIGHDQNGDEQMPEKLDKQW